jgi:hypothetical protein
VNAIVVISLNLSDGEQIASVLDHINPPSIPHFAGQVRIAVGSDAQRVVNWLEGAVEELP